MNKLQIAIFLLAFLPFYTYSQKSKDIANQIIANETKINNFNQLIYQYQDSINHLGALNQELNKRKSEAEREELKIEINTTVKKTPKASIKTDTYLKKEASASSLTLRNLKKGSKIILVERLDYKPYYKVIYKKKTGFVRFDHILLTGKLSELEKEMGRYLDEPSTKIESVSSYSSPSPSVYSKTNAPSSYKPSSSDCSSVQCSGRTKKGSRCKNKTTSCSGRCYLH